MAQPSQNDHAGVSGTLRKALLGLPLHSCRARMLTKETYDSGPAQAIQSAPQKNQPTETGKNPNCMQATTIQVLTEYFSAPT